MFEQITMADTASRSKPWSFAASITVQSILVAAALALPLMRVANLETRIPVGLYLPRTLGPPEPTRQATSRSSSTTIPSQTSRIYKPFQAPSHIPATVATGADEPGAPVFALGGPGGVGVSLGVPFVGLDLPHSHPLDVPPPEPPHPTQQAAARPAPIRVGIGVQAAKLVYGPKPIYPPLAKQARIAGTVSLAAQISADGHIRDLRVNSGHPMLIQAAIEAVRQWIYHPTLLNGQPVEVLTVIEVNFVLNP
jgi:protein TonB